VAAVSPEIDEMCRGGRPLKFTAVQRKFNKISSSHKMRSKSIVYGMFCTNNLHNTEDYTFIILTDVRLH